MSTEQITDAIINYFDNGEQDAHEIKGLLLLDHNQEVGIDFILEVINDYVYEEHDPSDEGFDPYLNCYTDDC
jgi:hypothetical protein